jgi:hypothetical protein
LPSCASTRWRGGNCAHCGPSSSPISVPSSKDFTTTFQFKPAAAKVGERKRIPGLVASQRKHWSHLFNDPTEDVSSKR